MLEHEWDQKSVQFPLDENSIVLDIGVYKGRWSKEIAARYGCKIYAFDPQAWVVELARKELVEFKDVVVYDHGLGVESGYFEMEEFETDGATFMLGRSQRQQSGTGYLIEMADWLSVNHIEGIDLIMMNIEGYEFKLIPYMIEHGIMQKVKYFMVQFHPYGYDQDDEYLKIRKQMAEIMDIHFDYGIVLVCWKAKEKDARSDMVDAVVYAAKQAQGQEGEAPKKPARKTRKKA